jgi:hypothetical protein
VEHAGHTEARGALFSAAAGVVDHQLAHRCCELPPLAGSHQRFKVAA